MPAPTIWRALAGLVLATPLAGHAQPLDGLYLGWEETITVEGPRIVNCSGFAFSDAQNRPQGCSGWSFEEASSSVIAATKEGRTLYFCRAPRPGNRGYYCDRNGWEKQK